MRTAKLETLGIDVPLKEGESFRDEGFVSSTENYNEYLNNLTGFVYRLNGYALGMCRMDSWPNKIGEITRKTIHIFYENLNNEVINNYVRAHEETHALDNLERLDLLENKILNKFGIKIDLNEIDDGEVIADVGAIYKTGKLGARELLVLRKNSYFEALAYYSQQ